MSETTKAPTAKQLQGTITKLERKLDSQLQAMAATHNEIIRQRQALADLTQAKAEASNGTPAATVQ